jgi:hypothetical protein
MEYTEVCRRIYSLTIATMKNYIKVCKTKMPLIAWKFEQAFLGPVSQS